jgi:hypothetical protein
VNGSGQFVEVDAIILVGQKSLPETLVVGSGEDKFQVACGAERDANIDVETDLNGFLNLVIPN